MVPAFNATERQGEDSAVTPLEFDWRTSGRNTSNGETSHPANGGLTMLRKGPSRLMPCFASPSSPFIVSSSPATPGTDDVLVPPQPAPGRPGKKRRMYLRYLFSHLRGHPRITAQTSPSSVYSELFFEEPIEEMERTANSTVGGEPPKVGEQDFACGPCASSIPWSKSPRLFCPTKCAAQTTQRRRRRDAAGTQIQTVFRR